MHEAKEAVNGNTPNGSVKLGYEVGTGEEVRIPFSHMIVTGMTQLSGKTTTLEAVIARSGRRAVVFKTKPGEKSFTNANCRVIAPFFRDRSDYEFVKSLIEAYAKEKLFLEKGTLMRLCKGSNDLIEIKRRIDDKLHPPADVKARPLRSIDEEIYTRLEHYLENLIPQIKYANFSSVLNLEPGINIMNLENFTEEAQSLIIQSTADKILKDERGVIMVIPEAWKFLPQKYNNPCKRSVESFIRQGATNENFVWIDSQDMSGVDKIPLKSISTWILGYQSERNEVKHTLDQIKLPKKSKPKEDEIMSLQKGHFYVSGYDGVKKVYVQPVWMNDGTAQEVAWGNVGVDDPEIQGGIKSITLGISPSGNEYLDVVKTLPLEKAVAEGYCIEEGEKKPFRQPSNYKPRGITMPVNPGRVNSADLQNVSKDLRNAMTEMRNDFFAAIAQQNEQIRGIYENLDKIKPELSHAEIDEIVGKVMQKTALMTPQTGIRQEADKSPVFDKEALIKEILARVPSGGMVKYELAPLEMIKRGFIQEAKDKIMAEIEVLSVDAKKVMKFVEARGVECSGNDIATKALFLGSNSGNDNKTANAAVRELVKIEVAFKHPKNSRVKGLLRQRIEFFLKTHDATLEEIDNLYNHIIVEMLK